MRVVAEAVEQIDAQRIEREIERDPEIRRQMRPGDLQPVRLEIVDQQLAEAAFLAQRLLGAGRGAGGLVVVLVLGAGGRTARRRHHRSRASVIAGSASPRSGAAFDEALMQAEFAVVADRDDAAGAGAVLRRE